MNPFIAIIFASLLARLSYQMARSPVLPTFAADLGISPEFIGVIVAASTVTGIFFKLPSGALSDVLGRKHIMVLGGLFFAIPPFLYPFVQEPWSLLALRFVHGFATAASLRFRNHRPDESIAAAGHGLDPTIATGELAQHPAQRRNLNREVAFLDYLSRPRGFEQRVLRNQLAGLFN